MDHPLTASSQTDAEHALATATAALVAERAIADEAREEYATIVSYYIREHDYDEATAIDTANEEIYNSLKDTYLISARTASIIADRITKEYASHPTIAQPTPPATHYHVVENTPGYLPDDTEPEIYATIQDAYDAAQERADRYNDDPDADYTITKHSPVFYTISTGSAYDLGRVIEITECTNAACDADA